MTEGKTFPENLLSAADLSVLECSTLLLLRRRTISKSVPTVVVEVEVGTVEEGDDDDNVDENERGRGRGRGKGELKGCKGKNKEKDMTDVEATSSHRDKNIVPVNLPGETIEATAKGLCGVIVKNIALLSSASAKELKDVHTAIGTYVLQKEMILTYEPYIGMKRVLNQLRRASDSEINLSKQQWNEWLWQPLAIAFDVLINKQIIKKIIFENQIFEDNSMVEEGGVDWVGDELYDEEETVHQDPAGEDDEVDVEVVVGEGDEVEEKEDEEEVEVQEEIVEAEEVNIEITDEESNVVATENNISQVSTTKQISINGRNVKNNKMSNKGTKKQKEMLYKIEVAALISAMKECSSLHRVVLEVVTILVTSVVEPSSSPVLSQKNVLQHTAVPNSPTDNIEKKDSKNVNSDNSKECSSELLTSLLTAMATRLSVLSGNEVSTILSCTTSFENVDNEVMREMNSVQLQQATATATVKHFKMGTGESTNQNGNVIGNENDDVVRSTVEKACRGILTATFLSNLLRLTVTPSTPDNVPENVPENVPGNVLQSSTNITDDSNTSSFSLSCVALTQTHVHVLDTLLSSWIIDFCHALQYNEVEVDCALREKLSSSFDNYLISLHFILSSLEGQYKRQNTIKINEDENENNGENGVTQNKNNIINKMQIRDNITSILMYRCFQSNSLRPLNALIDSQLTKSSLTDISSLVLPHTASQTSYQVSDMFIEIVIKILSANNSSSLFLENNKNNKNEENKSNSEVVWGRILDRADSNDKCLFVSLCALLNIQKKKLSIVAISQKDNEGVREQNDVFSIALRIWKESRSKVCMWIILTILREKISIKTELVENDILSSNCAEMMLSSYFNRDKGFYRSAINGKNNKSRKDNGNIIVISSWDDIENFLLPLLPENGQIEFSTQILRSLTLQKYFLPGVPGVTEDDDVTVPVFQPKKWARHASGVLILTLKGLSSAVTVTIPVIEAEGVAGYQRSNIVNNNTNNNNNNNNNDNNKDKNRNNNNLLSIVKSLGLGDILCWSQLYDTIITHTQLKKLGVNSNTLGFLTKTVYFFQCFLELNEQWRIDLEQNNFSKNTPWLSIAENVLLCEMIMNCLCALESTLISVGTLAQESVLTLDSTVRVSTFITPLNFLTTFLSVYKIASHLIVFYFCVLLHFIMLCY